MTKNRLIVVLGMHRSGTSVVTRGLQAINVNLGDYLIPPLHNVNEKGFFEDSEIVQFNDELLNFVGCHSHTLSIIPDTDFTKEEFLEYRLRAAELLRARVGLKPFGIKDPRISRLLPFWQIVFDDEELIVSYVIAVRNPMSIVDSLKKRDGFDAEKSYYLWLEHVLPALIDTKGFSRVVVDFDLIMLQPQTELRRIAEALSLPYDERSDAVQIYIKEFLDVNLRHTKLDLESLRNDTRAPKDVVLLYELITDIANDKANIDAIEVMEIFLHIRSRLQELEPALEYMARCDRIIDSWNNNNSKLNQIMEEQNERIDYLQKVLSDKDESVNELINSLAAVYKSRSWKITRPLRFLTRLFLNRKQSISRILWAVKTVAKSIRQHGLISTFNKISNRLKFFGFSNRYSSVPKFSANNGSSAISIDKDETPRNRTLISMIKNEKGVIETFAAHALAMFDRVIFVDHQSTDGTGEYLKTLANNYPNVDYFLFDEPGYYQSEVMTWIVKNIVGSAYNGWVFFLDADEYLDFASRTEFENKLSTYASFPIISLPWLNLVPVDTETGKIKGELFLKPYKTAVHCKIAFQPSLIPVDEYIVAQGNHALLLGESHQQPFPAQEAFPILHIPIRTKQQLSDKIKVGVESYEKMGNDRGKNEGFHWYEISRLIEVNGLTDSLMADMVVRYGEQLTPPYGKSLKTMVQEGYTEFSLDICTIEHITNFNEINPESNVDLPILRASSQQEKQVLKRGLSIILDVENSALRFKID